MAEVNKAPEVIKAPVTKEVRMRPLRGRELPDGSKYNLENRLNTEQRLKADLEILKLERDKNGALIRSLPTRDGGEALFFKAKPGEPVAFGISAEGPFMVMGKTAVEINGRLFRRERPLMPDRKPIVPGETLEEIIDNVKKIDPKWISKIPVLNENTFSLWEQAFKNSRDVEKIKEDYFERVHELIANSQDIEGPDHKTTLEDSQADLPVVTPPEVVFPVETPVSDNVGEAIINAQKSNEERQEQIAGTSLSGKLDERLAQCQEWIAFQQIKVEGIEDPKTLKEKIREALTMVESATNPFNDFMRDYKTAFLDIIGLAEKAVISLRLRLGSKASKPNSGGQNGL